jgi:hypothetical protein
VRHTGEDGLEHHGFVNVLVATARAFAGSTLGEVTQVLETTDPGVLTQACEYEDVAGARRWFLSFGSCSVAEPWADLHDLGLVT